VRAGTAPLEIGFDAPPSVREGLAAIGRTEDVRFAPGGRRLAIACFVSAQIAVAEVEITVSGSGPEIAVAGLDLFESPELREPHGIDFLDEDTLVVANRGGGIGVFRLPPGGAGELTKTYPVDGEIDGLFEAPGSVATRSLGDGRHEVLACNNDGNTLTRHTLDASGALVGGEVILRKWLDIPDGLALSDDGRWLAVSNHNAHAVFLYACSELGEEADPSGILRGVQFPHGLRFGAGGSYLAVADAGAPHVHVFLPDEGDWAGTRQPAATITVMDDETFTRGRHNAQEGGPKGLDVDLRSNVVAVTSECQPLAFFDLAAALESGERGRADLLVRCELDVLAEEQSTKAAVAAESAALRAALEAVQLGAAAEAAALREETRLITVEAERLEAEAERLNAEYERLVAAFAEMSAQLDGVYGSRSWRLTAPLRRAVDVARRVKRPS
jgi:hypothetical protein